MSNNIQNLIQNNHFEAFIRRPDMGDYIYIWDLDNDFFSISENATKSFNIPSPEFSNASTLIPSIIFEEDRETFIKSFQQILKGEVSDFISEYRVQTPEYTIEPVVLLGRAQKVKNGTRILAGNIYLKKSIKDDVTDLPLMPLFEADYFSQIRKHGNVSGFVLEIRIEGLERINENLGQKGGNEILKSFAQACLSLKTEGTTIYRNMGNKILILNVTGKTVDDAQKMYSSLKRKTREIESNRGYDVIFNISAGVVAFIKDSSDVSEIIRKVDFSLSKGRQLGKNGLYFFNAKEYSYHLFKIGLRNKLRDCVRNNYQGFDIFYQPIVDATEMLEKGGVVEHTKIIGAEALLRWSSEETGLVGADTIIPILEESGLMVPVGRMVLLRAFSQCKQWNELNPNFHMSVNLSYVQIERSDLLTDVQIALDTSGVNPENITLEITESGYISHEALQKLFDAFHEMKIKIDIDDFGKGYSNFRYVQNLHANTLKLDYSFIHRAVEGGTDHTDCKVISYITKMAHDLGMRVCFEGIESEHDIDILAPIKADKYQGFLFGKPVNAELFIKNFKSYLIKK